MNQKLKKLKSGLRSWSASAAALTFATGMVLGCGGEDRVDNSADVDEPSTAVAPQVRQNKLIKATFETPNEGVAKSDIDDPSVWVHPKKRGKSLIIATAKRGGMRVYDLQAREVQRMDARRDAEGNALERFNGVDVQYDFNLNGKRVDLAIATDRQQDKLRIFKIDASDAAAPLKDITSPRIARVFPTRPDPADRTRKIENPNDGEATSYGMTLWRDTKKDKLFALVNQNDEAVISMLELVAQPDGTVDAKQVRSWQFPYVFQGQDLTQENDDDRSKDFSPQFEGMAVDQQTGILYAGQEDVGIWRINLKTGVADKAPFARTQTFDPKSKLARDVEGVSIYYAADGKGYVMVSNQGRAHGEPPTLPLPGLDDTFAVFSRDKGNRYLGSFAIGADTAKGIDAVQECDGADVINISLPGFGGGLLITQDGFNDDLNGLNGEVAATNLKFTSWRLVAENFPGGPLKVDPDGYDPRNPTSD